MGVRGFGVWDLNGPGTSDPMTPRTVLVVGYLPLFLPLEIVKGSCLVRPWVLSDFKIKNG